ncbi:MAG: NmrA family NAD(P)-binding protein [Panacagrimonas sp.]
MTQTAFLIGATGNIGRSLLGELQADHAAGRLKVKVGVRSQGSSDQVKSLGLEPVPFDFDRWQDFDSALRGADSVFLLRPYTLKQMMHGKLVADSAKRVGVRHIVTIGAFGRPDTPWPVIAWNFLVEAYVERMGLAFTHLQPNYFMDNLLVQRDPVSCTIFNRITVPVSWIATSDIAAVAAAALRNPAAHAGKTYPLAAEAASVEQIAQWCSEITGQRHTIGITPREKMMERLTAQGREPEYALALVDYADAVNRGEVPEVADTFDTVERVAGRPALSFRDFLESRLMSGRLG